MRIEIGVGNLTAVPLGRADHATLHRFCLRSSEFFKLIGDERAAELVAADILGPLEPAYANGTKHVFGLFEERDLFAVAELLEGYPMAGNWFIGLLLVDPARRRKGIGKEFARAVITRIARSGGTVIRLVVQQQNLAALAFWKYLGFQVEYETEVLVGERSSAAWVLALPLSVE